MSPISVYHFILPVAWAALGCCWPMAEAERKFDLIIPRDSQFIGSSTTNGSAIAIPTITLAKEINTSLAGLILLLTLGTYWLLMRYTPTLSNEIILPSKLLEDNIGAVLSLTWPKHHLAPQNDEQDYPYPWVLFCKKITGQDGMFTTFHQMMGVNDFGEEYNIPEIGKKPMVAVKAFSPVMKDLVQIAIWNYVSLWLVLVMIVNTLVYNGFLSHNITKDGVIRLVLVGIYAVASIGHLYRAMTLLYRNFTSVLFQTCWTIICKEFVFGDYRTYRVRMITETLSDTYWTRFNLQLFGTMEHADIYLNQFNENAELGSYDESKNFSTWPNNDKRRRSWLLAQDKRQSKFDTFIKPIHEAELKAYEKATESALEKVLANVAVLLAICLATALAPWNLTQTASATSATSAQLGSYALLLSISAGLLALLSSMTQLNNATESARILLWLQEKTIANLDVFNLPVDDFNRFWLHEEPDFSLSKDIKGKSQLTSCSLWHTTSLFKKLPCLLLGPALMLIPNMHGNRPYHRDWGSNWLVIKVKDVEFACETVGSDFRRISPDVLPTPTRRERENMLADRRNESDNSVEQQ